MVRMVTATSATARLTDHQLFDNAIALETLS